MEKVLTVVIPTYNVENYLGRCLDSLTFDKSILKDLDIIVVNDGSKDNSLKVAREYEKKYECIKVIDKENGGHGSTINAGLKCAQGKYFKVIDSDDWVNIDDFKNFVNELKKLDQDIILTDFSREYIYNSTQIISKYETLEYNKEYNLNEFDFKTLKDDYFYMATSTIKTKILKDMNLKLDEKTFYVDMEYNIFPLVHLNSMIYLDYDIYRYFIGRPEQSISNNGFVNHRKDHEKVIKRILEFYNNEKIQKNRKELIKKILLLTLDSHYVIYCNSKIDKALKKEMKKEIRVFTKYLKEESNELYNEIQNKYLFIKANIKTNFIFACNKRNYFTRIALVIDNRRKKDEKNISN